MVYHFSIVGGDSRESPQNKRKKNGKKRTYGIVELKATLDDFFTATRNDGHLHLLKTKVTETHFTKIVLETKKILSNRERFHARTMHKVKRSKKSR